MTYENVMHLLKKYTLLVCATALLCGVASAGTVTNTTR